MKINSILSSGLAGDKFDEWRDVKWFELMIIGHSKAPTVVNTIYEINEKEEFRNIIENTVQKIK